VIDLARIPVLLVLLFAVYVAWGFMSGRRGRVPAYVVSAIIAISLLGAAAAQLVGLPGASEALDVTWFAMSLAALASPRRPSMWELQLRDDWEHARIYQPLKLADFRSWRGWLKLVDRIGARPAAAVYLGLFVAGLACRAVVWSVARASFEPFLLLALLAPFLFGAFSALWLYRGVRSVMPGA
jgi:hypothetical protein